MNLLIHMIHQPSLIYIYGKRKCLRFSFSFQFFFFFILLLKKLSVVTANHHHDITLGTDFIILLHPWRELKKKKKREKTHGVRIDDKVLDLFAHIDKEKKK